MIGRTVGRARRTANYLAAFATLGLVTNARPEVGSGGDAERGQAVYQACQACHAIDENDIGPKHRGVVGRPAASVPGFA